MSASARSKVKKIEKLMTDENEIVTDQQKLGAVVRKSFEEMFKPNGGSQEPVLSPISPRVSAEDNAVLEAPKTKEELQTTLFQMHLDNSLLVEINFDDNKVLKLQLVLLIFVLVFRIIS
jgi:hypothetical protein